MAKVTVYDLDNRPHEKEPIDARECCETLGWSMDIPQKAEPEVKETAKEKRARLALEKEQLQGDK